MKPLTQQQRWILLGIVEAIILLFVWNTDFKKALKITITVVTLILVFLIGNTDYSIINGSKF